MNNPFVFLAGVWVIVILMLGIFGARSQTEELHSQRYDSCIKAMQQAIPDPNDDSRASFLENCQK